MNVTNPVVILDTTATAHTPDQVTLTVDPSQLGATSLPEPEGPTRRRLSRKEKARRKAKRKQRAASKRRNR
jgi:hypothetical protein